MSIKKVNKFQLRQLLGMSATNWRRWWRRHKIHAALEMTEEEFNTKHWFYLDHYEKLKEVIGFDDKDLLEYQ